MGYSIDKNRASILSGILANPSVKITGLDSSDHIILSFDNDGETTSATLNDLVSSLDTHFDFPSE